MDYSRIQEKMASFLRRKLDETGAEGYVIGVSGGLDSAVTLKVAVEAVGSGKVHAWIMPGKPSSGKNMEDARQLCEELGVETREVDIEPAVDRFRESLDIDLEKNTVGNIRARVRMIYEYIDANENRRLVLGSGNRTEYLLGYFTKYGDGAVDVRLLQDLYKTEVKELAQFVDLDDKFIEKKPTAGLWKGQTDEDELGASYEKIDRIVKRLQKNQKPEEIASELGIEKKEVERFKEMQRNSEHKRSQVPYPELR
ncbi:MAG: NAD+ synthase [Candidatus Nanohaloarchaea archaeon]